MVEKRISRFAVRFFTAMDGESDIVKRLAVVLVPGKLWALAAPQFEEVGLQSDGENHVQ